MSGESFCDAFMCFFMFECPWRSNCLSSKNRESLRPELRAMRVLGKGRSYFLRRALSSGRASHPSNCAASRVLPNITMLSPQKLRCRMLKGIL